MSQTTDDAAMTLASIASNGAAAAEPAGSLEAEERAGGPPMPHAGTAAAVDVHGHDEPSAGAPAGDGMPGTAHDLSVKPDTAPAMSADIDQPAAMEGVESTGVPAAAADVPASSSLHDLVQPTALPSTLAPATEPSAAPAPLAAASTMPTPPSSVPSPPTPSVETANAKRPIGSDDQPAPSKRPRLEEEPAAAPMDAASNGVDIKPQLPPLEPPAAISPAALAQPPPPAQPAYPPTPMQTTPVAAQPAYATPPTRTKLPTEQKRHCAAILRALRKHKNAGPFLTPVDPVMLGIPHYPNVIKQPSDISTVDRRLGAGVYPTAEDFVADVRRIFTNCYTFNGTEASISKMAQELEGVLDKMLPKMPPVPEPKPYYAPPVSPKQERRQSTSYAGRDPVLAKREIRPPNVYEPLDEPTVKPPRRPKTGMQGKQLRFCKDVIREVSKKTHEQFAYPFMHPVDPVKLNIPHYRNIVKNPMDIGTVKTKLDNGYYNSVDEFQADFQLILDNCFLFNPAGTPVHLMGRQLEGVFQAKMRERPNSRQQSEDVDYDSDSLRQDGEPGKLAAMEQQLAYLQSQIKSMKKSGKGRDRSGAKPRTSKPSGSAGRSRPSGPRRSASSRGDFEYGASDDDNAPDSAVTFEMKRELASKITTCEGPDLEAAIEIIRASAPRLLGEDENQEIELDIDMLDDGTLLKLYDFVVRGQKADRRNSVSGPRKSAAETDAENLAMLQGALPAFDQAAGVASPSAATPTAAPPQPPAVNGHHPGPASASSDAGSESDEECSSHPLGPNLALTTLSEMSDRPLA